MPTPSQAAWDRVSTATRYVEGMRKNRPTDVPTGGERGPELCWCKLIADLDKDGTADAHPLRWSASSEEYQPNTDVTVTVRDTLSQGPFHNGDWVACRYLGLATPVLEVFFPRRKAILMTGTTTGAVASTDATFTVSGLSADDGGQLPDPDDGDNWTVSNWDWAANSGTDCAIQRVGNTLRFLQGPCKPVA